MTWAPAGQRSRPEAEADDLVALAFPHLQQSFRPLQYAYYRNAVLRITLGVPPAARD